MKRYDMKIVSYWFFNRIRPPLLHIKYRVYGRLRYSTTQKHIYYSFYPLFLIHYFSFFVVAAWSVDQWWWSLGVVRLARAAHDYRMRWWGLSRGVWSVLRFNRPHRCALRIVLPTRLHCWLVLYIAHIDAGTKWSVNLRTHCRRRLT